MKARGMCSRREGETLIFSGRVRVNGEIMKEPGRRFPEDSEIEIIEDAKKAIENQPTVILNKPEGIVSHLAQDDQIAAYKLVKMANHWELSGDDMEEVRKCCQQAEKLNVAGRLDRASRGLLVLSRSGRISRELTAHTGIKKEYLVQVDREIRTEQLEELNAPIWLDGKKLLPMNVEKVDNRRLRFVLEEGKKHQIRRVCRKVLLRVLDLYRYKVGPVDLGGLPEGKWRLLTEEEKSALMP